ncbi:tRNA (adenosine(37)-N6)-threonylcarbamoyltransferase complex dimerization subunit type 1 TsaB [Vibrio sp. SCSIO 43137]|uniref:tRNA (adenosine(37)-N6)-threonylcarbamoyltransferase complex dimerization subunit type 1 TsaB n=1 Tax=Vibrio sp. SCSIO 43137 TaxID=3021011 RepID=UPI002306FBD1|nr:tRNA (adenosine(37)-N6)-threonylcarbamoyltransferase complex dimerization subunit type 1 TsaB [Vibrio sp. SCSIO 43137]WCE30549.1 tRNA (adenosine(37)-N6)-threonylcarbamoyltransferase complex dimerization subunit type 1 TsaB [Vibrio sp. SCSIO 43137]
MSTKILALDTSTENCSVALLVGDKTFSRSEVSPRGHTTKVLPMVDEVLKEAGVSLNELDALAFGRGPGSFTGVRIGIGIAQGLAFGADLPMIGVSTLKAMAQAVYRSQGQKYVASAIDARMSEVYWGRYQRQDSGDWLATDEECVIPPAELKSVVGEDSESWYQAGTGWAAYSDELSSLDIETEETQVLYPEAEDIAFLAQFELAKGNTVAAEESSPVYLRDKVAWKKLPGRE